jgi:hypothetical protein
VVSSGRRLLVFLLRLCSNEIMDTLRKRWLEKIAGNSIIAWGVVSLPLSFVTGTTGRIDCGGLFVIWAGFAVRSGSRTGSFFALLFSALGFVGNVAIMVSAATYGIAEIGTMAVIVAAGSTPWMLLNMALLSELRRWRPASKFSQRGDGYETSADGGTPDRAAGTADVLASQLANAPIVVSHRWFPQFSLRSLFVLAILVALGSAIGTQPIGLPRQWTRSWITPGGSGKSIESWTVHVAASRSGVPAVGYLRHSRRTFAKGESASGTQSSSSYGSSYNVDVDGQTIAPGRNFVLVYREGEGEPQRLEMPKEDAAKIFDSGFDESAIEKFWREKIEPLRATRAKAATP